MNMKGRHIMAKATTAARTAKHQPRPVLVTTVHRGIFFGYAEDTSGDTLTLTRARLCVYWSPDVKGFMGLAATGPSKTCRIGPAADITLHGVTAVLVMTPAAVAAWEAAPWGQ